VTPLETQLLFARAVLLILLYSLLAAVGIVAWLDLRAARKESSAAPARADAPRLIVLDAGDSDRAPGTAFQLDVVSTLGRDLDNDVVLADPSISGRHAVVSRREDTWWIEDLDSTNGSFVNDDIVGPGNPTPLRSGDLVQLGAVKMRLVTPGA
jgi:hypothetical protein